MLAQDDPERIQVLRDGEPIFSKDKIKILSYVDAWNTMTTSAKEEFMNTMIPDKLKKALEERKKLKDAIG